MHKRMAMALRISLTFWPLYLVLTAIAWGLLVVIYRRWFHPLSKIPGPFLWSISALHILYYQVCQEGQMMHQLPKLHRKYGPVVRIAPNEIHLNDPENFNRIFSIGSRFFKDKAFYGPMEGPVKTPVVMTMVEPDVHRARRASLNPFFSRRSVLELESVIWEKARKFLRLMKNSFAHDPTQPFDMNQAIRAFSVDVVTEYSYARCWNHLDEEDFGAWYQESMRNLQLIFIWLQAFPFLIPIFGLIPDRMQTFIMPFYKQWVQSLEMVRKSVEEVRQDLAKDIKLPRRTIFHELMDSPSAAKTESKLKQPLSDAAAFADGINIVAAAAETTGATAERAIFEVIHNPTIYKTLIRELHEAFPQFDDMNYASLEKLPFLTGVVKEALRLHPGVPGRAPRVVPLEGATFNDFTVPRGTIVSISTTMLHQNADIFPDPEKFDPYRWIGSPSETRAREKYLVPFGKGTRNCLGQNLAICELYCSIAGVFHSFDNLQVAPGFSPADMELVTLLLLYHPRNAKKFGVIQNTALV